MCEHNHLDMFWRKLWKRTRLCVGSALHRTHRWMDKSFYKLGHFVSEHAVAVLVISLVIALALSTGLARLRPEDKYEKLWATPGSKVDAANEAFGKYFATSSQPAQVIVTRATVADGGADSGTDGANNMLRMEILIETLRLHETLLLVLSEALREVCQPLQNFLASTQDQVAERPAILINTSLDVSDCANINGALSAFSYSAQRIGSLKSADIGRTILEHFSPSTLPRQPAALYVGNISVLSRDQLSKSPALRLVYSLDPKFNGDFGMDKRFVDAVDRFSAKSNLISAMALGPSSLDRETERSLSSDFWLVGISGAILIVFSVLNAGNIICCDTLHSRTVIALCGMLNVALALGASIGLATYCGVTFSAIQVAMICVILAIGVDDMFVLCDSLARQDPQLPRSQRIGNALSQVGVSIMMTSTTDAVTFALVAIDAVPGVEAFAINATLAVIIDFILQVTFFVACLALDERRVDSQRVEVFCCWKVNSADIEYRSASSTSSEGSPSQAPPLPIKPFSARGVATIPASARPFLPPTCLSPSDPRRSGTVAVGHHTAATASCKRQHGEKLLTYLFREKYAPFVVQSRWLRFSMVAVSLVLCSVSIYGITQVSSELQLSNTIVDDSFVLRYQELDRTYFSSVSLQVELVIIPEDIATISAQQQLYQLSSSLQASSSFHPYVVSWFDRLCNYSASCNKTRPDGLLPPEDFAALLQDFLNTTVGQSFRQDVKTVADDDGRLRVKAARFLVWQVASLQTSVLIRRMQVAQDIARSASAVFQVHSYSPIYRYLHQVRDVQDTGYRTVVMSLGVVMVITWFFFEGSFIGALFCTVLIAIVNLNLFGFMPFLGLEYNHASHTVLIIGIGFSIDYVAHLILAFARAKGDPDVRVKTALTQMGSSVFSGSLTTFLGVLSLIFGSVEISRIFAKLICMLISLSAFYGLVLSPIVLLYLGQVWRSIAPKTVKESAGTPAKADSGSSTTHHKGHPSDVRKPNIEDAVHESLMEIVATVDRCLPPAMVAESIHKSPLSTSLNVLPVAKSPARVKPTRKPSRRKSTSMSTLHGQLSHDFPPLYKAARVRSDCGVAPDSIQTIVHTESTMTILPMYSAVICESSL